MDQDLKLLQLFALLIQKPRTVREISVALGITRWRAYWLVHRLKAVLLCIPEMPQLKDWNHTRERIYYMDRSIFVWRPTPETNPTMKGFPESRTPWMRPPAASSGELHRMGSPWPAK